MVFKTNIKKQSKFKTLLIALTTVTLAGCSAATSYDSTQTPGMSDPFEGVNRKIFAFNAVVDHNIINPTIDGYRAVVPTPARKGLNNALNNLQSPVHFANQLLQGDLKGAGNVAFSAIVNTFVGFGGLLDVAGYEGYNKEEEDFGQTLAVWGVDHGPYLVIPFLGGISARDGVGYAVDSMADPVRWYADNIDEPHIYYNKAGLQYLNLRNNLKDILVELEVSSLDYYASMRSTYYQSREALIHDNSGDVQMQETVVDFPEYDDF